MKAISKQMAVWMIALVGIFSLCGCDEDWWNDWGGSTSITGQWKVVEVTGWNSCPYRQGDYWTFYYNGQFAADGSNNLRERGYWQMRGRTIEFAFPPHDDYVSMSAYVSTYDDDYMTLRVNDYDNNANYTLRLVRYSY